VAAVYDSKEHDSIIYSEPDNQNVDFSNSQPFMISEPPSVIPKSFGERIKSKIDSQ